MPRSSVASSVTPQQNDDADLKLFDGWLHHSDLSFHSFDETIASEIRSSLLTWYRQHRRKLPWRGDPPPYDGSTAGTNNHSKKSPTQSTKITTFFQSTKESHPPTKPASDSPIPVSAYGVWVSEIMLQQTRVEAVIPYWLRWMTTFPTVHELASATEDQVNAHWAGLGFYRRARLLHQGAQFIVNEYQGELPTTVDGLLKITGIGPYTASAIASIAFGVCVPVVDGNVCRVLSRLTGIANHIKAPALKDKYGWDLAAQLVQGSGPCAGEINQALMELGATYCAPSGTGIDPRDPLKDFYYSTRIAKSYHLLRTRETKLSELSIPNSCPCPVCDFHGIRTVLEELEESIQGDMTVDEARKEGHSIFPLDPPKKKKREEDLAVAVLSNHHDGEIWWLLVRRPSEGLLANQWEFPSVCIESRQEGPTKLSSNHTAAKRRKLLTQHLQAIMVNGDQQWWSTKLKRDTVNSDPLEHIFSHVRHVMWLEALNMKIDLTVTQWKTSQGREVRWMSERDMKKVGITSGVKKILKVVQTHQFCKSAGVTKKRKR